MVLTVRQLQKYVNFLLKEANITPDDEEIDKGDVFLALINNRWTPVKIAGLKIGLDDLENPDPNRILYKLKSLGSLHKVGQTRPAMSLRRVTSNLKGKPAKFGKKYSDVK